MAKRYSHSERQQHLDAWQQSGLTKQHYCRQHDLNPATFYYWLKHHHDDATVPIPAAFIPARQVMPGNNDADTVTFEGDERGMHAHPNKIFSCWCGYDKGYRDGPEGYGYFSGLQSR
ncbi:IS66 family insertion sequence element accessory protein TnpA [Brenneria alni]|uniref:IS66 family insertion sequence element accessory protein TnpA n=1 Tax=Brenneria alni TaxID=71656 RepID=UPI0011C46EB3|nr:hypothetical protein [Brenneria alni]